MPNEREDLQSVDVTDEIGDEGARLRRADAMTHMMRGIAASILARMAVDEVGMDVVDKDAGFKIGETQRIVNRLAAGEQVQMTRLVAVADALGCRLDFFLRVKQEEGIF